MSGCVGEGGGPQAEPQQYPWRYSLAPTAALTGGTRPAILKLVQGALWLSAFTAAIHNQASPDPCPASPAGLPSPGSRWQQLRALTLGLPAAPGTT